MEQKPTKLLSAEMNYTDVQNSPKDFNSSAFSLLLYKKDEWSWSHKEFESF